MRRIKFAFYIFAIQAPLNLTLLLSDIASAAAPVPQTGGQQPSGNTAPTTPSPGITGGTAAIESTILSYRALSMDANNIADAIGKTIQDKKAIVIATPTDFANLLQWRTTMAQAALLDIKLKSAVASMDGLIPGFFSSVSVAQAQGGGVATYLPLVGTAISTAQSLFQTISTLFAVNQSLSVTPGDLTSLPLTNLLADLLSRKGFSAYIPSIYAPNLLQGEDITGTFIQGQIDKLERDRKDAAAEMKKYADAVAKIQTVTSRAQANGPFKPGDTLDAEKAEAMAFGSSGPLVLPAATAAITSAVAAIDAFESTLFSGASGSLQNQVGQQAAPQAQQQVGGGAQPPVQNPPAGPQPNPAPPLAANPPATAAVPNQQNPGAGAVTPSPAPNSAAAGGSSVLPQILSSDLLARQIWSGPNGPSADDVKGVHVLVVQTLESGGGQLTKSNVILGSSVFFSGGAVVTFGLFRLDGRIECGGYAYAYGGYIKEGEKVASEIANEKDVYPKIETSCKAN